VFRIRSSSTTVRASPSRFRFERRRLSSAFNFISGSEIPTLGKWLSAIAPDCNTGYNLAVTKLKIRAIGSSHGIILPKEILDRMALGEGDELFAVETSDGLKLTAYDPEFEKWLDAARDGVKRYRNTLKALAKL
jgi:putative addiction module antidote